MTIDAEGREVPYQLYKDEIGENFLGCNIPPNIKHWNCEMKQNYLYLINHRIAEEQRRVERIERDKKRQREEAAAEARKVKAKVDSLKKYLHLVVENDLDTSRFQINHILDFDDLKKKIQAESQPRLGN
nr:hypothetical protein Iba_chr02cCG11030 [Ipomoea batatas]GMC66504.1 hypothetical protein Iba_chr02eCG6330 [Ipomoea batatas]